MQINIVDVSRSILVKHPLHGGRRLCHVAGKDYQPRRLYRSEQQEYKKRQNETKFHRGKSVPGTPKFRGGTVKTPAQLGRQAVCGYG